MFALMAAIIPTVASLYVATSYLLEQARLAHEYRARHRILRLVEARRATVAKEMARSPRRAHSNYEYEEVERFTTVMLRAYGLPEDKRGSYTDNDVRSAMTGTLEHASERQRQWVLLLSSMTGVVLLAIDAFLV